MHTSTLSHEGVNQYMYYLICIQETLQLKLEFVWLVPSLLLFKVPICIHWGWEGPFESK